jgi:hypothetical protein
VHECCVFNKLDKKNCKSLVVRELLDSKAIKASKPTTANPIEIGILIGLTKGRRKRVLRLWERVKCERVKVRFFSLLKE